MENHKEGQAWMTVPAFGDWDMKNGAMPDYSMDFSKIREMRKQNKKELSRASLGGDDDILAHHQQHQHQQQKPAKAPTKLGGEEEVPELFPVLYQGLKNCYRCLHLRVTAENILANLV